MRNKLLQSHLHLAVQKKVESLLFSEHLYLEYKIKNRRADIFWEKQNVIFEIQCSPISLQEVKERTHDYESQGLRVIWILHQKTFNKKTLSEAELFLRKRKKAYYTNISQHGQGIIYDQEEAINLSDERICRSRPLEIDLSTPVHTPLKRLYFKGDLCYLFLKRPLLFSETWREKLKIYYALFKFNSQFYYRLLKHKTRLS
ncbi:MAG: hypothetical protein S4CHLAM20_05820 [Chlamydiia bacterium]|nr:hypothetical protein [Chlamydiia bacterium]